MNSTVVAAEHKPLDVIVFGATSFVGAILVRNLAREFGVPGAPGARSLRWGIAGRSRAKLDALLASLVASTGKEALAVPVHVADVNDEASLEAMCAQARVIVSTVGPYLLYGEPLVRVCARTGTDYCDLTGESPWVARMIERYGSEATTTGSRLVPCCGFDSIPSDMGVQALQEESVRRFHVPCVDVKMMVHALRGGASGGTLASMMATVEEARRDPAFRRALLDPYALCPPGATPRVRQPVIKGPSRQEGFAQWVAPFVMASVNVAVVLRSNELSSRGEGVAPWPSRVELRYQEALRGGEGAVGWLRASAVSAGLGALVGALAFPPSRRILRSVLPAPGEGPSVASQERGFFDLRFVGRTASGDTLRLQVTGDRDPGYGSTGRMLAEAGACLAKDSPRDRVGGGFWTPSTAMGPALRERLVSHAGLRFTFLDG